jgi:hypothetical protein
MTLMVSGHYTTDQHFVTADINLFHMHLPDGAMLVKRYANS